MRKILSIFAVLLLIPSLAFATKLTDQEYRDQLINTPINESFDEDGFSGTVTAKFNKDGTFVEHTSFKSVQGSGTWDLNATWSVNNAVLHMHITNIKHSDTHNKKLNKMLDDSIAEIMKDPDFDLPLDEFACCARSVKSSFKGFMLR